MSEERKHFRIDLEALVQSRPLDEQEAITLATEIKSHPPTAGTVDSETVKMNKQIQDAIAAVTSNNMQMGHLLGLMNQKINIILRELEVQKALNSKEGEPAVMQMPVNISGGGALIYCDDEHMPNTQLDLKITFIPEHVAIRSVARVIKAFPADTNDPYGKWKVAVEFSHMHDEDQDRVVRKVLQEQTKQLRAKKRAERQAAEEQPPQEPNEQE